MDCNLRDSDRRKGIKCLSKDCKPCNTARVNDLKEAEVVRSKREYEILEDMMSNVKDEKSYKQVMVAQTAKIIELTIRIEELEKLLVV